MDNHVTKTIELLAQYTDEKPDAGSILIACQLSALVDAVQRTNEILNYIDDGIDESNRIDERRLDRGQ
jgi:hypothetical protein